MSRALTDYKVLTFDCYGTLIDWESGIWDALQPLLLQNRCQDVVRAEGLRLFAKHETHQEHTTPDMTYPDLLRHTHRGIANELKLETSDELDIAFGQSVPFWPAFPDSADALRRLKRHYRLVILSNVNRDGFAASNRRLGVEFDAIYTAQDIGSYKPNPANFDYMLSHLQDDFGLAQTDILHTAQSIHHDHIPAKRKGLDNAWIDRQRLSAGGSWGATANVSELPDYNFLFFTLMDMADAVEGTL
ncbi:MAG: haloacid dehalogenase type II [Pseudomonadota bacterium]